MLHDREQIGFQESACGCDDAEGRIDLLHPDERVELDSVLHLAPDPLGASSGGVAGMSSDRYVTCVTFRDGYRPVATQQPSTLQEPHFGWRPSDSTPILSTPTHDHLRV